MDSLVAFIEQLYSLSMVMTLGDCSLAHFQNQVTIIKLNHSNYVIWKKQIRMILKKL